MVARRVRIYDALALLTVILVVALDQWTKALVVANLTLNGTPTPLIGNYLTLNYIRNSGAAFGLFSNSLVLVILIVAAIVVISYLYLRFLNTGTLAIKLIFGMIIGGALGNLIDRARHSGFVVDFIFFRIPQIGFRFAIFNLADASISGFGIRTWQRGDLRRLGWFCSAPEKQVLCSGGLPELAKP